VSLALYERLYDIKERCEQLVEDVHGDPSSVARDRVLAKAVLYNLHVIGGACRACPRSSEPGIAKCTGRMEGPSRT
jgi:hypothetical protein